MSKNLYIEILEEENRPDPKAPGGYVRVMVSSGKCATFDEKELAELIQKTQKRLRLLKKLRQEAETHSVMITEGYLKYLEIPFKVKELVKKQC